MAKLIIVSNRLPFSVSRTEDGGYDIRQNVGGLATAIGPYHASHRNCAWVGWSGENREEYSGEQLEAVREAYARERCSALFLSAEQVKGFYSGFSNDTLWPLFHDFSHEAVFKPETWDMYQEVNRIFADAVAPMTEPGDTVWIQDYHLMLLPQLLRERCAGVAVGWFLHVPFPSPEIFRALPWSREILTGVLGADLLGFHTVDFAANFTSCVRTLLDLNADDTGRILTRDGHTATVDAFPIGIDYNLYRRTARSNLAQAMRRSIEEISGKRPGLRYSSSLSAEGSAAQEASVTSGNWWSHHAHEELPELTLAQSAAGHKQTKPNKIVVSVDRLDYTKGLPERLRAFDRMLERYPEWTGHVTYYLLATPSRQSVRTYQRLKDQVDQLVGAINGKYSLLAWTPIHYITRSLPIKPVCGIYAAGDVALVTPLRDGMNLVAKEYLACHDDRDGALVLSDMCGAADELTEAFIVNPYDIDMTCEALHQALEIAPQEARRRNTAMQNRLKANTAGVWCASFLDAIHQVSDVSLADRRLRTDQRSRMLRQWDEADRRLVLCDYDGTLTPLMRQPQAARPTRHLRDLIARVATLPGVDFAIVSGRGREVMNEWFGSLPIRLIAEHGAWQSMSGDADRVWDRAEHLPNAGSWQPEVLAIMQRAVQRVPRSMIERKTDVVTWHYRNSDQRVAMKERAELLSALHRICGRYALTVIENAKVIEVCPVAISKGRAIEPLVSSGEYGFMLAAGDDATDETMFAAMPENSWTLKVGAGQTKAHARILNPAQLHRLFGLFVGESQDSR